ncbi:para-aminobenzoate synthase, component I [Plesiocystis pacifica SIR-1]|uniref:Para-aminobenzoate synthase, component I n=1 Tax=Plesiocystis pacifica SIR-1 TaxID=391625 RepID=A6G5F5_9BACT|nr:anthranilate synthase component I family protein [Plesiocystis pacifica]EDM78898.1 para-aminobenzoate synthase, component I [Plesiocystis pacifica SIR-1]
MSGPAALLDAVVHGVEPELCWLDGGAEAGSAIGRRPDRVVVADDLAALDEVEASWRAQPEHGWIGWVSYDLGAAALLGRAPRSSGLPHLVLRRYPNLCRSQTPLDGSGLGVEFGAPWPLEALRPELAAEAYRDRVRAALESIRAGDTYQINASQKLFAPWTEAARTRSFGARVAAVYHALRRATPATMGALILVDSERAIVSNSPETLLDLRLGGHPSGRDLARSWPIKGTRPRDPDPRRDRLAAEELCASAKDRAEHVMIVDLVRNDLGSLAVPGTVRAPRAPSLVSLPTVHHLVSEVSCALAPGWSLRALFAALFPGGSITGAPKRRSVEIIDELEGEARGIYCGAIMILDRLGVRVSIPIRTGVLDARGLELRSGGGIVADSDPEAERLETLAKARAFDRGR